MTRQLTIWEGLRVQHFAKRAYVKGAQFLCADFRYTIPVASHVFEKTVIYCDPPYLLASATADFTAYGKPFTATDHRDLVGALISAHNNEGCVSVFSGSDTEDTRQIYYPFTLKPFEVRRSVGAKTRYLAGEVIGTLRVCDCCGAWAVAVLIVGW
ncbi:DNA adenine methylase [Enterobacter bugandensis]|uniref:DNA adenine methylase n=1 Tax=Enterobacter bugandensis TaxID=881260 RepID=UPI002A803C2D|nr:DNA adenine methylase [Enterobacter bugandensis]